MGETPLYALDELMLPLAHPLARGREISS